MPAFQLQAPLSHIGGAQLEVLEAGVQNAAAQAQAGRCARRQLQHESLAALGQVVGQQRFAQAGEQKLREAACAR